MRVSRWIAASTALAVFVAGCAGDDPVSLDSVSSEAVSSEQVSSEPVTAEPAAPGVVPPRAEDPDLDDLDVALGRLAGVGALVDLYRPTGVAPRATVVVFGDSRVPASGYAALAARLVETADVAVGVADRIEFERAAAASGCVMETTAAWAAEGATPTDGEVLPMIVVGLGDGAVVAIGEGFDGTWAGWSGGDRCAFDNASAPVVLAMVAGALRAVPPSSFAESLDPFDQVGANQYLQIRTLLGSDGATVEEGALARFHEALLIGSYDAELATSTLPTNELFGGGGSAGPTGSAVEEITALLLGTFVFSDAG